MKAQTLRQLRQWHHIIGIFLAPAILLFAFSGALQTFRLQEEKGYGGTPPAWIIWMAAVHKDQALPRAKPAGDRAKGLKAKAGDRHDSSVGKRRSALPLKIFAVLVAIGLFASTLMGVVIALNNRAMRGMTIVLLIAGTIVPVLLLYM